MAHMHHSKLQSLTLHLPYGLLLNAHHTDPSIPCAHAYAQVCKVHSFLHCYLMQHK